MLTPDSRDDQNETDGFPPGVPEIAKDLARFAKAQNASLLPPDYALNHNHYLHGAERDRPSVKLAFPNIFYRIAPADRSRSVLAGPEGS